MAAENIIKHSAFETTTIVVIILNCVTLAMEDPSQAEQPMWQQHLEVVFLALYTLEMVLKIVGLGFILNRKAYLKDPWNILDFIIVMSAYLTIAQDLSRSEEFA